MSRVPSVFIVGGSQVIVADLSGAGWATSGADELLAEDELLDEAGLLADELPAEDELLDEAELLADDLLDEAELLADELLADVEPLGRGEVVEDDEPGAGVGLLGSNGPPDAGSTPGGEGVPTGAGEPASIGAPVAADELALDDELPDPPETPVGNDPPGADGSMGGEEEEPPEDCAFCNIAVGAGDESKAIPQPVTDIIISPHAA